MKTKDDLVEFVRTLICGDLEANDRYEQKLDEEGWDGWPQFLAALFAIAINRRFGGHYDEAQVIRFAAELRIEARYSSLTLNPLDIETLIKAVLVPAVDLKIAEEVMGEIQILAVYMILTQEKLFAEALDNLLDDARSVADKQPREATRRSLLLADTQISDLHRSIMYDVARALVPRN